MLHRYLSATGSSQTAPRRRTRLNLDQRLAEADLPNTSPDAVVRDDLRGLWPGRTFGECLGCIRWEGELPAGVRNRRVIQIHTAAGHARRVASASGVIDPNVAAIEWPRRSRPAGGADSAGPLRPVARNPLSPEVNHFTRRLLAYPAEPLESPYTHDRLRKLGADVIAVSERLRRSAGVVFPADLRMG